MSVFKVPSWLTKETSRRELAELPADEQTECVHLSLFQPISFGRRGIWKSVEGTHPPSILSTMEPSRDALWPAKMGRVGGAAPSSIAFSRDLTPKGSA